MPARTWLVVPDTLRWHHPIRFARYEHACTFYQSLYSICADNVLEVGCMPKGTGAAREFRRARYDLPSRTGGGWTLPSGSRRGWCFAARCSLGC
eukprot:6172996-Pleurochrysis_carterae.AAC.8